MVTHAGEAPEDRADQRDHCGTDGCQDARRGRGLGVDGDPREAVEIAQDVPLAACHGRDDGDDDGDGDGPDADRDPLLRPVATSVTTPILIAVPAIIAGVIIVGAGGGLIKPMQQRWEAGGPDAAGSPDAPDPAGSAPAVNVEGPASRTGPSGFVASGVPPQAA